MSPPPGRPQADTFQIQHIVERVLRGEVRIPPFQRNFRWSTDDVLDLLDSVYRGFPIGTLLLWKKPAEAAGLDLGPVHIDADAYTDALWVVDGQQRLTSLVAVLACPAHVLPANHMFEVFFDLSRKEQTSGPHARSGRFIRRPHDGPVPPAWLPMGAIIRPDTLDDWIDTHLFDKELRKQARLVSTTFREYEVPAYIVTTPDEQVVITMFDRTNNTGRRLEKAEIFNALHAKGETPADLRGLAAGLAALTFGDIDPKWLLKTLFALRNKDVTQIQAKRFRDLRAEDLRGALSDTERALERTIVFLRRDAGIPHIALLPYRFPLLVLARFFHAHASPRPRSRALLARWVWAGAITGEHRAERIPYVRQALKTIDDDEEGSVQRLIAMVSWNPPWAGAAIDLSHFRFGTAESRLHLSALAALHPLHLDTATALDVGTLLTAHRGAAVQHLAPPDSFDAFDPRAADSDRFRTHLANRVIHPPLAEGCLLSRFVAANDSTLRSHGFDAPAIEAIRAGNLAAMLTAREGFLQTHVQRYLDRRARWAEARRKSLQTIVGIEIEGDHVQ